jgi:hypothetical protein
MDFYDDNVNHYKVAKKDWTEWSDDQRCMYNRIYSLLTRNPEYFPDNLGWKKIAKSAATEAVKL